MDWNESTRRSFLKQFGAAGAMALAAANADGLAAQDAAAQAPLSAADQKQAATRDERMKWWHEAKFGMFIHWGLYSVIGQHEWVKEQEGVPIPQYEILAKHFKPKPNAARDWARLAKKAGQKYMVMTTKHHEGFCQWDTKLTDFKVTNTPYGKDTLRQLADACHRRNFPLCLYYSIADWHSPLYPNQGRSHELQPQPGDHPDLKKYVEFVRGQVRELCTNYGKISGFWWDMYVDKLPDPSINAMIRELQPGAVINNRGFDEGDFGTPERDYDRTWDLPLSFDRRIEACQSVGMESWGYRKDEDYYSHRYLTSAIAKYRARDANYLLNVGPNADGVIPEKPAAIVKRLGPWYKAVRESFDDTAPVSALTANRSVLLSRKGNSLYVHLFQPPEGEEVRLRPLALKPERAVLLNDGRPVEWRLDIAPMEWTDHKPYLRLHGLPVEEFAGETMIVRIDFASLDGVTPQTQSTDPTKSVSAQ